jgi:D-xylose transport system substrate-binding protein
MSKKIMYVVSFVMALSMLVGCAAPTATAAPAAAAPAAAAPAAATAAPAAPAAAAPAAGGKIKVGLSFSDFATERWKTEDDLMTKALQAKGYDAVTAEANHDTKLQNDQIDNFVSQGAKGIIVIAEDGDSAATAVAKAADAGVKVLAYDRYVNSPKDSCYMTFDNTLVGVAEADGVVKALGLDKAGQTTWTKDKPAKIFLMGGSPTDNNAHLVRNGQLSVVQKYFDSGVAKQVGDQWVDNWDPAKAESIMENALTANKNQIDAVIASNDGTAGGAVQALQAQKLTIPISGQDATAAGANLIVKGLQTVTVYKDTRVLAAKAVEVIDLLINGKAVDGMKDTKISDLTGKTDAQGTVPVLLLPVVEVTKDNVYDVIVKSGFQKYDDVYRDIPADKLPPKP